MKKNRPILLILLSLLLQSCDKVSEIYQQNESLIEQQSSQAQDSKAKQLYTALQSYDSNKVKDLLDPSLRQEIEQSPVAMIEILKLVPEGHAKFAKTARSNQSLNAQVGAITTQVYMFEYPKLTTILTVVFKGHRGGDQILAFTLDQINSNDEKTAIAPEHLIKAEALAMDFPQGPHRTKQQSLTHSSSALSLDSIVSEKDDDLIQMDHHLLSTLDQNQKVDRLDSAHTQKPVTQLQNLDSNIEQPDAAQHAATEITLVNQIAQQYSKVGSEQSLAQQSKAKLEQAPIKQQASQKKQKDVKNVEQQPIQSERKQARVEPTQNTDLNAQVEPNPDKKDENHPMQKRAEGEFAQTLLNEPKTKAKIPSAEEKKDQIIPQPNNDISNEIDKELEALQ